jgi:hypothetical protein
VAEKFVVKVLAPQAGTEVLIINEDKTIQMLHPFDKKFQKMMGKNLSQFFWASIEGDMLKIKNKAPWQEWSHG